MFDTVAQDILHNCSSRRTRHNPCITGATYYMHMYILFISALAYMYMTCTYIVVYM